MLEKYAGRLLSAEPDEKSRYRYIIWFPYTRELINEIQEGDLLAVPNFQSTRGQTTYSILKVTNILPKHFALRGRKDTESYPGYVMEAAKNIAASWTTQEKEPLEDTTAFATSIANQTSILGGKKPILQRLGDLMHGNRSTWERINRSNVKPTMKSVTPGDISMALPHRILTDIIEGLEKLDQVIPGVASPTTLLYAPEIKFSANQFPVDNNLETTVEDLFVAGDGVGLSRGLVQAAATGIIAARGIINKNKS